MASLFIRLAAAVFNFPRGFETRGSKLELVIRETINTLWRQDEYKACTDFALYRFGLFIFGLYRFGPVQIWPCSDLDCTDLSVQFWVIQIWMYRLVRESASNIPNAGIVI